MALLVSHPFTSNFTVLSKQPLIIGQLDTVGALVATDETSQGLIDSIALSSSVQPRANSVMKSDFLPASASIGDVISMFGSPDFVWFSSRGVFLIYGTAGLTIRVFPASTSVNRFSLSDPVTGLMVYMIDSCPPNVASESAFSASL